MTHSVSLVSLIHVSPSGFDQREHLTDVVIHQLLTEEKVRIQCRDLIKKIAIYKNRLAVRVPAL